MKKLRLLIFLIMLLTPAVTLAAGSSMSQTFAYVGGSTSGMSTLTLDWVSDSATGAVTGTTDSDNTAAITGKYISVVVTDPGATAPTDDYDITITDANGVDVMGGSLVDRDTSDTEQALPYVGTAYAPRAISGALTISVSNAGNSKVGSIIVYFMR